MYSSPEDISQVWFSYGSGIMTYGFLAIINTVLKTTTGMGGVSRGSQELESVAICTVFRELRGGWCIYGKSVGLGVVSLCSY